jgi:hypothetical protein
MVTSLGRASTETCAPKKLGELKSEGEQKVLSGIIALCKPSHDLTVAVQNNSATCS